LGFITQMIPLITGSKIQGDVFRLPPMHTSIPLLADSPHSSQTIGTVSTQSSNPRELAQDHLVQDFFDDDPVLSSPRKSSMVPDHEDYEDFSKAVSRSDNDDLSNRPVNIDSLKLRGNDEGFEDHVPDNNIQIGDSYAPTHPEGFGHPSKEVVPQITDNSLSSINPAQPSNDSSQSSNPSQSSDHSYNVIEQKAKFDLHEFKIEYSKSPLLLRGDKEFFKTSKTQVPQIITVKANSVHFKLQAYPLVDFTITEDGKYIIERITASALINRIINTLLDFLNPARYRIGPYTITNVSAVLDLMIRIRLPEAYEYYHKSHKTTYTPERRLTLSWPDKNSKVMVSLYPTGKITLFTMTNFTQANVIAQELMASLFINKLLIEGTD